MKTFKLDISRIMHVVELIEIEANSPEEAKAKFEYQLATHSCDAIEADGLWDELHRLAVDEPYYGGYEVIGVEEIE